MRVIKGEGVNDLYVEGVRMLKSEGVLEQTRNGPALVMPTPVTSVYKNPVNRVLLNRKRNANPFFHLFESLWMLAGRDDVMPLNYFIGDFGQRFAEDDGRVHGAYGFRWRRTMGFDQIEVIVERLKKNPQDRQCVLQMWDSSARNNDLCGVWKDRPCNTHVYFRVRDLGSVSVLDMTVCCRSNDIIYGAYGANAVHFSILMEYVAGRLGIPVGVMYQVSNNYHAYVATMPFELPESLAYYNEVSSLPMGDNWEYWDYDLLKFMSWWYDARKQGSLGFSNLEFYNAWFSNVVEPMFVSFNHWKSGERSAAVKIAERITASDWRKAALQWYDMRMK